MSVEAGVGEVQKCRGKSEDDERNARLVYEVCHYAGTDSVESALKNWQAEREAMRELHDVNAAMRIYYRRLNLTSGMMENFLDAVEKEGVLFLPQKVLDMSAVLRSQLIELEKSLVKVKLLIDR